MMTQTQMLQAINAVSEKVNDINARLDEALRLFHAQDAKNISTLDETMDAVLTEELPAQSENIQELADTVESILTEVIPSLVEG